MTQAIDDLQKKVKTAQFELDQVLKNGGDTFKSRKHLQLVQKELHDAQAADRKLSENEQADTQAALSRKAAAMIGEQANTLNAEFSGLLDIQKPKAELHHSLALNILTARSALATAKDKKKVNREALSELQERRSAIVSKKQALIDKRTQDTSRDDTQDASTLALFDLDLQRLDLLIEEEKTASVIDTSFEQNILSNAEMMLTRAVQEERIRCMIEITSRLEIALIAAASQLASMGIPASRRYKPSQVLRSAAQMGVF